MCRVFKVRNKVHCRECNAAGLSRKRVEEISCATVLRDMASSPARRYLALESVP